MQQVEARRMTIKPSISPLNYVSVENQAIANAKRSPRDDLCQNARHLLVSIFNIAEQPVSVHNYVLLRNRLGTECLESYYGVNKASASLPDVISPFVQYAQIGKPNLLGAKRTQNSIHKNSSCQPACCTDNPI